MRVMSTAILPTTALALTVNIGAWESSMTSLAAAINTATGADRASLLSQFNALGTLPGYVASINTNPPGSANTAPASTQDYASFHAWESAMQSQAMSLATATGAARSSLQSGFSALQATPGVVPSTSGSSVNTLSGGEVETITISGSAAVITVPPAGITTNGVTFEPSMSMSFDLTGSGDTNTMSTSNDVTTKASSSTLTAKSSGITAPSQTSSSSLGGAATAFPAIGGLVGAVVGVAALL